MLKQLKEGSIKIILHGEKLQGEWALVHTKQSENSWLLIKHKDEFASSADVTNKSKSVVSGKTLLQLEKSESSKNGTPKSAVKKVAAKKAIAKKAAPDTKKTLAKNSKKKVKT